MFIIISCGSLAGGKAGVVGLWESNFPSANETYCAGIPGGVYVISYGLRRFPLLSPIETQLTRRKLDLYEGKLLPMHLFNLACF